MCVCGGGGAGAVEGVRVCVCVLISESKSFRSGDINPNLERLKTLTENVYGWRCSI